VFVSDGVRPRLIVWGMFHAGGGYNADVPSFLTRAYVVLFDETMRRRFEPFLHGPVNAAAMRRRAERQDVPQLLLTLDARYTEEARRRKIEGGVELEFSIRPDGTVRQVTLIRGLDGGLDQLTLAAAPKWLFAPAMRNGVAVEGTSRVTKMFHLPPE